MAEQNTTDQDRSREQFWNRGAEAFGATAPENYERFFVRTIGAPLADDLVCLAAIRPGERVLDVACGTGVVARLAAQEAGPEGKVAGIDVNPAMLAAARAVTPAELAIEWHEGPAEAMPLPDEAFDVVLCQISLQFMADRLLALREMRRVLAPGGRLHFNVPGPAGEVFAILAEAVERHISAEAAGFVNQVFSWHDSTEIEQLLGEAGFRDIALEAGHKVFNLPSGTAFLWQYAYSTPLAGVVAQADETALGALDSEVAASWRDLEVDGKLPYEQRIVVASARK